MKLSQLIKENSPILKYAKEFLHQFEQTGDVSYYYAYEQEMDYISSHYNIENDNYHKGESK